MKLEVVDDPRGLWDGISRISANWPALLGMGEESGRYALTLELPHVGVIKGHALVDPALPPFTVQTAARNITREVMPAGKTCLLYTSMASSIAKGSMKILSACIHAMLQLPENPFKQYVIQDQNTRHVFGPLKACCLLYTSRCV